MKINFTQTKQIHLSVLFTILSVTFGNAQIQVPQALLQVIHNAADPELLTVDVYVDDLLLINDAQFRQASPFETVAAGVELTIDIAPANSQSASESIFEAKINLLDGTKNIIMLTGVVGDGFAPNPDDAPIDLTLKTFGAAKDISSNPNDVEVNFWQGVTDAPVLNVVAAPEDTLVKNIGYNMFANYDALTPGIHSLYITNSFDKEDTLGAFSADFTDDAGKAIMIFASGFLDPAANNDGPAFGLFAALPSGEVVQLNTILANVKNSKTSFDKLLAYPVPSSDQITLEIENSLAGTGNIELVNPYGVLYSQKEIFLTSGKNEIRLDLEGIAAGQYMLRISTAERTGFVKCVIVR